MRRSTITVALVLATALAAGCASGPGEEVKLGGISLVEVLDGLSARTGQVLKGLQQGGSGTEAAAELASINDGYDDLIFHAWRLQPKGQDELAKRAEAQLGVVRELIWKVEGSPLEASLADPLEAMRDKISVLMVTPYRQPE